jgi:insulysin
MRKIVRKHYYTNTELADAAGNISLADVNEFGSKLLKKGYIQGLVYGNVTEEQARQNTNLLISQLKIKAAKWNKVTHQGRLELAAGEDIIQVVRSEVNNSCFSRLQYFGNNSIEEDAQSRVIGTYVESPFFLEMRTSRQLGYIVWGGARSTKNSSFFIFIIQSGDYTADNLSTQADEYTITLPDSLKQLPDEEYLLIKNAVIEKIKEKPTSIAEKAGKYYTMAFDYDGNFSRNEELIEAVENLTKEEAVQVLSRVLDKKSFERATVLLYAKEHEVGENINSSFDDINQWKNTRNYK